MAPALAVICSAKKSVSNHGHGTSAWRLVTVEIVKVEIESVRVKIIADFDCLDFDCPVQISNVQILSVQILTVQILSGHRVTLNMPSAAEKCREPSGKCQEIVRVFHIVWRVVSCV